MFTYDGISISEAAQLQKDMAAQVTIRPLGFMPKRIAGADVSFNKFSPTIYAAVLVFSFPELVLESYSLVITETYFPYVSGYLAFREAPSLIQAWEQIPDKPELIVLDGHGITHPRRVGIASHFGILTETPAIGCAKSMLYGEFPPLAQARFSTSPISAKGALLGQALRTKDNVSPVFVSPGHLIDADDSVSVIKRCVGRYRIPEPTRQAHHLVNLLRTGELAPGFHQA
jgi:deoxyribonuclease V